MNIPILSNIVDGMKSFLKTRRYISYLSIFIVTTFIAISVSWLLSEVAGTPTEEILIRVFAYIGAAGTIYFMIGTVITALGLE